jgi:hypothetical protein
MMITLIEVLEKMKELNEEGYTSYFKGMGNCYVAPIVETFIIINKKEENKLNILDK